jgi:hypothetical protein
MDSRRGNILVTDESVTMNAYTMRKIQNTPQGYVNTVKITP